MDVAKRSTRSPRNSSQKFPPPKNFSQKISPIKNPPKKSAQKFLPKKIFSKNSKTKSQKSSKKFQQFHWKQGRNQKWKEKSNPPRLIISYIVAVLALTSYVDKIGFRVELSEQKSRKLRKKGKLCNKVCLGLDPKLF